MRKLLNRLAMWWLKPTVIFNGTVVTDGDVTIRNCNIDTNGNKIIFYPSDIQLCTTTCRTAKCVKAREKLAKSLTGGKDE